MNHAKRKPGIPKRRKPQKNAKVVLARVVDNRGGSVRRMNACGVHVGKFCREKVSIVNFILGELFAVCGVNY
jgi:hypothetical protein